MATNDEMAIVNSANKSGKLESVNIELAENGFMVSCTHRQKQSKKNEPMPWTPPQKKVFESRESLIAYLQDALPASPGGKESEEEGEDY